MDVLTAKQASEMSRKVTYGDPKWTLPWVMNEIFEPVGIGNCTAMVRIEGDFRGANDRVTEKPTDPRVCKIADQLRRLGYGVEYHDESGGFYMDIAWYDPKESTF